MRKAFLSLVAVCATFCTGFMAAAEENEKPLITIGCLSDLHNQQTLINPSSGKIDDIKLRGTVSIVLEAMAEQENIDMLILGGDYTSDVTINSDAWGRVKELLNAETYKAFPEETYSKPVIYCVGNHDYEVANFDNIPKNYNAGYYEDIMAKDIAGLGADDCFYEKAENGTGEAYDLLAAYYYQIQGFDFVVLNCGKYFFTSAWDYTYSQESVDWVANKLDELYAEDPGRTVFAIVHVPFSDSNSISASSKGIKAGASTTALKEAFAKWPNTIMLYGHDHGTDTAYIRAKTSQRVTRYNTYGNVISAFDEDHVDGLVQGVLPEPDPEVPEGEYKTGQFAIVSVGSGKYLGADTNNGSVIDDRNVCTVEAGSADGTFRLNVGDYTSANGTVQHYLHIGSGGKYSIGDASDMYFYKVTDTADGTITAAKAETFNVTDKYLLVAYKDGTPYALKNELYNGGVQHSQRIESTACTVTDDALTVTAGDELLWQFDVEETTVDPGVSEGEQTAGSFYIVNKENSQYLGADVNNACTLENANVCIVEAGSSVGTFRFKIGDYTSKSGSRQSYLHIGSAGRFSIGDAQDMYLYKVNETADGKITAEKATAFTLDDSYLIVGEKDGTLYALSNTLYQGGVQYDQRMESTACTATDGVITVEGADNLLWQFVALPPADPSFFSCFMGSMRYYNNTIDGASSPNNSKVAQALMIYVYKDRVVFQMKNYGKTGTISGISIAETPEPYTLFRDIHQAEYSEIT